MPIKIGASRLRRANPVFLAAGGYLLLAAVFYAPVLIGLYRFPDGDFTQHFLPFSIFLRREWLAGRLPLWNPYTYSGHPFLADPQSAVFYPLGELLLLLTLPWGAPVARLYFLQIEAALHLGLAGFFTYLLARDLMGNQRAAFLSGCAFAFSGYLTGYPPLQLSILRTGVWLPLVLWLLMRASLQPKNMVWWMAAAAAYATAFLAGHAQTFLFLSYIVAAWMLLLFIWQARQPSGRAGLLRCLWGGACFYPLWLGLSAIQLWPSLEFFRLSTRAEAAYASLSGGFPLRDTWQMLLPGLLSLFSPLYVGIPALGLVLLGLGAWALCLRQERPLQSQESLPAILPFHWGGLFFGLAALFFLLLSYGDEGFLYPLFYRWAPGGRLFRGQERAAYGVSFGLSLLAGYGAVALERLSWRARKGMAFAFVSLVAMGVIAFGLHWQLPRHIATSHREFLAAGGKALAFALLFGLVAIVRAPWRTTALTILLLADLFLANFATHLVRFERDTWTLMPPEVLALEGVTQEEKHAEGLSGRAYQEGRIYENYGMVAQVEDAWGASPLRLAGYERLLEDIPIERAWRLAGVEYLLTWRRELPLPSQILAEFPARDGHTYLHRLSEAHPRAWLVSAVHLAEDAEALRLLADGRFDLAEEALAPPEERGLFQNGTGEGSTPTPVGVNAVRLARPAPHRLSLWVSSERGGMLVVSENWMPGWQALRRDGRGPGVATPVLRADLTLLGVEIPPGEWTIELTYHPKSVCYGGLISGASLAALMLMGTGAWRKGQREARDETGRMA